MTRRKLRTRRVVARFVLGQPLNGRRYSNATFWRRGTRRTPAHPYVMTWDWWTLAAGWQRAGIRLAAAAVTVLASVTLAVLALT